MGELGWGGFWLMEGRVGVWDDWGMGWGEVIFDKK